MDPPDYNRKFAEEHDFGYPLISNGEAVIRQFGACRREDRCTGKRTTAVIRADGTLLDFIDPFDADTGPEELLKRLVDGAPPLTLHEPGAHMDGLERVRRRRKKKMLRGHDTFHHSGEHRRAGA